MILLDTDHTTFPKYPESERGHRFTERLLAVPSAELVGAAIVTIEERMRGWLAVIGKERSAIRQVVAYAESAKLFEFYQEFEIVPCDAAAARKFDELRKQRLRIGTMDLKVAATALVHGALLLSANLRDFNRLVACESRTGLNNPVAVKRGQIIVRQLFIGKKSDRFIYRLALT